MRRIPTLLEVERRHILNTLYLCGSNRALTAKALGVSVRSLRIKLHQYEKAGFAVPAPLSRDEACGGLNMGGPTEAQQLREHEAAPVNVIEEMISLVDAIAGPGSPGDADASQMTPRREKT